MVTSNKLLDKKVVKMAEQNNTNSVVPQRTLLEEVNPHLTCYLCRGYYIDATTIVECLHSFCRSCIIKHLQVKSYCPVCEMMINSVKPNIKPDKQLQDIVYKLVPGLFQKEMERRQQFYASRPGPAASATPEQRGEDTERIIFSPEDVISFSLEYADLTDADSISSKSSDSSELQQSSQTTRRYLQCPAVVNISHLKKFISMKFDIDSTQFSIDILYKRVPLPDYYTLMDIAYIYNWKRNEPMRFFYQITDYIAIRSRYGLFDINRKGSHFRDRKFSPTPTEETNSSSPAPRLNEQGSETSSGTDSPMPDDSAKKCRESTQIYDKSLKKDKIVSENRRQCSSPKKSCEDEVEKSQFLNSFELTAKNNWLDAKSSPEKNIKSENKQDVSPKQITSPKSVNTNVKCEDNYLKRKQASSASPGDIKKFKGECDKTKSPNANKTSSLETKQSVFDNTLKTKEILTRDMVPSVAPNVHSAQASRDVKQSPVQIKQQIREQNTKPITGSNLLSPKQKQSSDTTAKLITPSTLDRKPVSPIKLSIPKSESSTMQSLAASKSMELQKSTMKKMPELKLGVPSSPIINQNKGKVVHKVRMDLLANNCDPTMDRTKILSQVKSSLSPQTSGQSTGDPLKSLFDSCKINIPSSLSITLTDQKLDPRALGDTSAVDSKKVLLNKNNSISGTNTHKVPSPPVHNYIEILKLPDVDPKKPQNKAENNQQNPNPIKKPELVPQQKNTSSNKTTESTSAKGPMPSLKPIADTKIGKQSGFYSATSPYQQKYIQSLEQADKCKLTKNKMQVPKLMPATPKTLNKDLSTNKVNANSPLITDAKPATGRSDVLDLSKTQTLQSQLGAQQTKVLETMQSIANYAKQQGLTSKGSSVPMSQNPSYSTSGNRSLSTGVSSLRIPSNTNQMKLDKGNILGNHAGTSKQQDLNKNNPLRHVNTCSPNSPSNFHLGLHNSQISNMAQPSARSQTRSPSSSPKLVIAEEKQSHGTTEINANQSNQITSTQMPNLNLPQNELAKSAPGPSKTITKPLKTTPTIPKVPGMKPVGNSNLKSGVPVSPSSDINMQSQLNSQALMRQHFEWLKKTQYELLKNMHRIDFNKDAKQ